MPIEAIHGGRKCSAGRYGYERLFCARRLKHLRSRARAVAQVKFSARAEIFYTGRNLLRSEHAARR